nr:ATP-dependent DNA helicase RecG [Candidatus Saccharibacteria bacterium]
VVVEAVLSDGVNKVRAVWFNQPYRAKQLKDGEEFFFSGDFEFSYNRYQVTNPRVMKREELPKTETFAGGSGEIVPIYRQIRGLKTDIVRKILSELKPLMKMLPETLPENIVKREKLISRSQAVEWVHFPKNSNEFERALDRLAFEEIFQIMLAAKLNKVENEKLSGYEINFSAETVKNFIKDLPFGLTSSQRLAAWEIIQDLGSGSPMNRLLQGDVGSGKTVVAAIAALSAARDGYQSAILAPTEILASQHAESLSGFLANSGARVGFLAGSVKGKARQLLYEKLEAGEIDILIGTHAIIQDKVKFKKLGLVVIDEQHRFGVDQRQKLLDKSHQKMPHLLTMTATPIPRSLQLTLFGDLSVSILKEKPKGRKPVATSLISPNSRKPMVDNIKKQLDAGSQAFVVVPAIIDNQKTEVKSIETEEKRLKSEFKNYKILTLHGKMKPAEKETAMKQFIDKKADILLSTTVVEVGVDVPNASVIVIENADRFGLAQLHQLRGRVGRGSRQAFAYLVMSSSAKPPRRLLEIEKTNDGFLLAEKDLQLRGPGEIYGKSQSGELNLEFASLGDTKMISRVQSSVNFLFTDQKTFEDFVQHETKTLEKYQRLTILN